MVLDDDQALLELYGDVLADAGYDVLLAHDGREGIELLRYRPDAFVVDLMMPRIGGCEFIRAIRRSPEFHATPALLVSASEGAASAGARCGADGYVRKPFELDDLLAELRAVVQRAHASERAQASERAPAT